MKKVIMTFATVDATGKADGGSLDVEFAVDQKASPPNSVSKFRITLTPSPSGSNPLEYRLTWSDSAQLGSLINSILSANPVP